MRTTTKTAGRFLKIPLFVIIALLASASLSTAAGSGALGVEVGSLAPEFSLQDAAGKWVSLSDFRGKKVYLFSWATWCRCREQLPELQKFYEKFKSDKFEVIAVASDSEGFKWVQPYLDEAGASYTALVDPNHELARKYNFLATENGFLIDEGGVIRMSKIGFDIRKPEQRDELMSLMKTDFKAAASPRDKKTVAESIAALEEAISKKPESVSDRMELAELHRQSGNYDKAEAALLEVIGIKKRFAEAHFRLGVVLYQQGRVEDAVKSWEKAYRYDTTNYIYMRTLEAHNTPEKFYAEEEFYSEKVKKN